MTLQLHLHFIQFYIPTSYPKGLRRCRHSIVKIYIPSSYLTQLNKWVSPVVLDSPATENVYSASINLFIVRYHP